MKALYYPDWNELELRDVDPPRPAKGEVLIRVAACGICGSEIETFASRSPRRTPPLIMGHEFCGVIETMAAGVEPTSVVYPGARVIANAVLHCGRCDACLDGLTNLCANRKVFGMHRPGAFAEFVTAPAGSLFEWPENVSAEEACLAEPLANGIHVARLLERLEHHEPLSAGSASRPRPYVVLIIGAGSIGLMCLQAMRNSFRDARCIVTDLDPRRLVVAETLGAEKTVASGENGLRDALASLGSQTGGPSRADVVIDAAGFAATKQLSLTMCRPGGSVVWIGLGENEINLHSYVLTLEEKAVFGSYGATGDDIREALRLMETRRVDVSTWVTSYRHRDWVEGFERQIDPSIRDVKAVLVN
ncbi:MAG: zinc-binding dehydrogenase [Rhodothermia bacterium]